MSADDVRQLAQQLAAQDNDPLGGLRRRSGLVTAVNRANNSYTVTVGGVSVPGVLGQAHVQAAVGDTVDVLLDGAAPRIIGGFGVPRWHVVGAGGEPGFENGWTNNGGSDQTAGFLKDSNGFVHLRGLVKGGAQATVVFTLPVGFRPTAGEDYPLITSPSFARGFLIVAANGAVVPNWLEAGSLWVSLAGLTFYAG